MLVTSSAPIVLRYSVSIRPWAHAKLIRQNVFTVTSTESKSRNVASLDGAQFAELRDRGRTSPFAQQIRAVAMNPRMRGAPSERQQRVGLGPRRRIRAALRRAGRGGPRHGRRVLARRWRERRTAARRPYGFQRDGKREFAFFAGPEATSGFNFDAKVRRQSIEPVDLIYGHIRRFGHLRTSSPRGGLTLAHSLPARELAARNQRSQTQAAAARRDGSNGRTASRTRPATRNSLDAVPKRPRRPDQDGDALRQSSRSGNIGRLLPEALQCLDCARRWRARK